MCHTQYILTSHLEIVHILNQEILFSVVSTNINVCPHVQLYPGAMLVGKGRAKFGRERVMGGQFGGGEGAFWGKMEQAENWAQEREDQQTMVCSGG